MNEFQTTINTDIDIKSREVVDPIEEQLYEIVLLNIQIIRKCYNTNNLNSVVKNMNRNKFLIQGKV